MTGSGGGVGGGGGDGVGGVVGVGVKGLGLGSSGARICPRPDRGDARTAASGAASTPKLPAESPIIVVVVVVVAESVLLLCSLRRRLPEASSAAARGAQPTRSLVTAKSLPLGRRSTAFPPALPQV